MEMYDPPHPGEILKGLWLDPMGISINDAAKALGISRNTLSKVINGKGRITPEIALRLSVVFQTSAESWMGHQVTYDLWHTKKQLNYLKAHPRPLVRETKA
ncbi:MAG TPA: HigA family addiction module antitoxin [Thermodesulfovibrionia bacterium]|nr:HigA family addiction module antitoxin [Thermodesulfovibrionia bacterium]